MENEKTQLKAENLCCLPVLNINSSFKEMSSAKNFADRRSSLFGRKADADFLVNRVLHFGLTAVAGRPKIGKTWLLEECGRRLADNGYLVGYHECHGEHDQILHVVSDLYARWLLSADITGQAAGLWERHKDSLVSMVGQAVGTVFAKYAAMTNRVTKNVGKLVQETFQGLARANVDLKTGGLSQVVPLPYDQAVELIQILTKISGGKRIVLIMDGWEQSPSIDGEKKVLDAYLKHPEDWPNCHVLLGIRHPELDGANSTDRGWVEASDLKKSSPQAHVRVLELMNLDADQEKQRLASHVRARLPIVKSLSDSDLLELIQGFPGVLGFWISEEARKPIMSAQELKDLADDAQVYRYREFDVLFPSLSLDIRTLAIRLALLPRLSRKDWRALNGIVLGSFPEALLDELNLRRVLDGDTYPTYGHETRHAAALKWFSSKSEFKSVVVRERAALILRLGGKIRRVNEEDKVYGECIVAMSSLDSKIDFPPEILTITECAGFLFGIRPANPYGIREAVKSVAATHPDLVPLLAHGLVNTLNWAIGKLGPDMLDLLLDELRSLSIKFVDQEIVRERLAAAMFTLLGQANVSYDVKRRDRILTELRQLSMNYSGETEVIAGLARGIFNELTNAGGDGNVVRRDTLLAELRQIAFAHPLEPAVRQAFARGLTNVLSYARAEGNVDACNSLLLELRQYCEKHAEDFSLQNALANSLFNVLCHALSDANLAHQDGLLHELEQLTVMHLGGAEPREAFATGLSNSVIGAIAQKDTHRRDALLKRLQKLSEDSAGHLQVHEQFASALLNALNDDRSRNDIVGRDKQLAALRMLCDAHTNNATLRARLADGLHNTLGISLASGDLTQVNLLLGELRQLNTAYPSDRFVEDRYARVIWYALQMAKKHNQLDRVELLQIEQRRLAKHSKFGEIGA